MAQNTSVDQLGAFSETFKLAIAPYGSGSLSTYYDFQGLIGHDSISIDEGEKGIESIPVGGGGRVVQKNPKADTTITFTCYPVEIDFTTGGGISMAFRDVQSNWDTGTEPMEQTDSRNRDTFLVAFLVTDDSANTGADEVTAASTNSFRWIAAHCFMTGYKPSFDGTFKVEVTFTVPATTKTGESKIHECSGVATALPAVNNFGSSKFPPTTAAGTALVWHG